MRQQLADAAVQMGGYEWDLISRTLAFKNAVSKGFVWFDRAAYKLYKSARVHTQQPKKLPGLVWVILFAVGMAAWKIPESYARITGKNDAARLAAEHKATDKPKTVTSVTQGPPAGIKTPGEDPAPSVAPQSAPVPIVSGCARLRDVCQCYDSNAQRVDKPAEFCQAQTASLPVAPAAGLLDYVPDQAQVQRSEADLDLITWVSKRRS